MLTHGELESLGGGRVVTVDDPHEGKAIELDAVPMRALLDKIVPSWRSAEEVVATCTDGFHPAIPVRTFLEHEGFLAYARHGAADFEIEDDGIKKNVGPYYLVWTKGDAGTDPPEPDWPYAVVAFDVTDFAARFAAAFPPPDAGAPVTEGFERFRTFCLPCHTINGRGGGVGPELNYPESVTEYIAEPVLRQWITNPALVRWNAKMPPPLPEAERARDMDPLLAYLRAMATAKRAPRTP